MSDKTCSDVPSSNTHLTKFLDMVNTNNLELESSSPGAGSGDPLIDDLSPLMSDTQLNVLPETIEVTVGHKEVNSTPLVSTPAPVHIPKTRLVTRVAKVPRTSVPKVTSIPKVVENTSPEVCVDVDIEPVTKSKGKGKSKSKGKGVLEKLKNGGSVFKKIPASTLKFVALAVVIGALLFYFTRPRTGKKKRNNINQDTDKVKTRDRDRGHDYDRDRDHDRNRTQRR